MKINLKKTLKILLFALIVIACAYILKPGLIQYAEQRDEQVELEAEIEEIKTERAQLEERYQKLKDEDPELIERLAREKLQLSKPGETVFKFKKNK
jgi:cell division protein FtsB